MIQDEVSAMRLEIKESCKAKQKDRKSPEQVVKIAEDFSEMKTLIHDGCSSN